MRTKKSAIEAAAAAAVATAAAASSSSTSSPAPAAAASAASAKRPAADMDLLAAAASSSSPPEKKAKLDLPRCPFGEACYRKNPEHIRDFDHSPAPPAAPPAEADATKPHCPYGHTCYRANPAHRIDMYHAPAPKVKEQPYPTPFAEADFDGGVDACLTPYTLRELDMMALMGAIKEKPQWFEKVHDKVIAAKWCTEAAAQHARLTPACLKWVIEEVKWQATQRVGPIQQAAVDGVWQADGLISDDLKEKLVAGVAKLENVPPEKQDWHPGTNKQVLDLVHPSLFPYLIGQSRVTSEPFGVAEALDMIGSGEPEAAVVAMPKIGFRVTAKDYSTSEKFAWLPAEVSLTEDGKTASFDSYINNLHPVNDAALYPVLGDIFQRFVPLFERVLTHLCEPTPRRYEPNAYSWYDKPNGEEESDHDDDDDWYQNRPLHLPDVGKFQAPEVPTLVTLGGRKLQVIVKLANIILTPEQPKYNGGSWHVEGMKNEAIVASGISYFESSNISESRLAFRQACSDPEYEQSDDRGMEAVYGLANESAMNQVIGSVITQADRCIAFPNVLQHQVQPFQLLDPTKEGLRKILVFFLVDPTEPVVSTATVPPQQAHWLKSATPELYRSVLDSTPLIDPLIRIILDSAGMGTFDMARAEEIREELMLERKHFVGENSKLLFEREFSLCEH